MHFIRLLAGGPEKQLEALSYARHFQPFARLHQRGMCPGCQVGIAGLWWMSARVGLPFPC